jgi:hypothetical protein
MAPGGSRHRSLSDCRTGRMYAEGDSRPRRVSKPRRTMIRWGRPRRLGWTLLLASALSGLLWALLGSAKQPRCGSEHPPTYLRRLQADHALSGRWFLTAPREASGGRWL